MNETDYLIPTTAFWIFIALAAMCTVIYDKTWHDMTWRDMTWHDCPQKRQKKDRPILPTEQAFTKLYYLFRDGPAFADRRVEWNSFHFTTPRTAALPSVTPSSSDHAVLYCSRRQRPATMELNNEWIESRIESINHPSSILPWNANYSTYCRKILLKVVRVPCRRQVQYVHGRE